MWFRARSLRKRASEALEARDGDGAESALAELAAHTELTPGEWYDWGLAAKFRRDWAACADRNARALELGFEEDAAIWNLGIAAEILRDPARIAQAWHRLGRTETGESDGMPLFAVGRAPVRLPNREVVWCDRLSPARALILNIPLADSERCYRDVVVHDGEPNGERVSGGRTYSVFDELARVVPSRCATFIAAVSVADPAAIDAFEALIGDDLDLQVEDWTSSVTIRCEACASGTVDLDAPGHHHHDPEDPRVRELGIAAPSLEQARALLDRWCAGGEGRVVAALDRA